MGYSNFIDYLTDDDPNIFTDIASVDYLRKEFKNYLNSNISKLIESIVEKQNFSTIYIETSINVNSECLQKLPLILYAFYGLIPRRKNSKNTFETIEYSDCLSFKYTVIQNIQEHFGGVCNKVQKSMAHPIMKVVLTVKFLFLNPIKTYEMFTSSIFESFVRCFNYNEAYHEVNELIANYIFFRESIITHIEKILRLPLSDYNNFQGFFGYIWKFTNVIPNDTMALWKIVDLFNRVVNQCNSKMARIQHITDIFGMLGTVYDSRHFIKALSQDTLFYNIIADLPISYRFEFAHNFLKKTVAKSKFQFKSALTAFRIDIPFEFIKPDETEYFIDYLMSVYSADEFETFNQVLQLAIHASNSSGPDRSIEIVSATDGYTAAIVAAKLNSCRLKNITESNQFHQRFFNIDDINLADYVKIANYFNVNISDIATFRFAENVYLRAGMGYKDGYFTMSSFFTIPYINEMQFKSSGFKDICHETFHKIYNFAVQDLATNHNQKYLREVFENLSKMLCLYMCEQHTSLISQLLYLDMAIPHAYIFSLLSTETITELNLDPEVQATIAIAHQITKLKEIIPKDIRKIINEFHISNFSSDAETIANRKKAFDLIVEAYNVSHIENKKNCFRLINKFLDL